jgi:hypothetical protein
MAPGMATECFEYQGSGFRLTAPIGRQSGTGGGGLRPARRFAYPTTLQRGLPTPPVAHKARCERPGGVLPNGPIPGARFKTDFPVRRGRFLNG